MPELPEVITIRNDLRKHIIGRTVKNVLTYEDFPLKPSKKHFDEYVIGAKIEEVRNIAKLLVIKLSSGYYLTIHLRMTGNIFFNHRDDYIKISLELDQEDYLHFSTVRKFGYLEVWNNQTLADYTKRFGKSMLEENLQLEEFLMLVSKRKAPIKSVLLNQEVVSGIGNIYANDALYLSKIHPTTPANSLNREKLRLLFHNLNKVLQLGIKHRGSSIDRFRDIFGNQGNHQNHFYVYGKTGETCTQCKKDKIIYAKMHGRGTFFCPTCQPKGYKTYDS